MRITAFMNQKGGVGKTTTVVNLGAVLAAEHGRRVLLVDADPQANLSDSLGLDPLAEGPSIYDVLLRGTPPEQVLRRAFDLDVMPANLDLAGAEIELAALPRREERLREALRPLAERYAYVLVDCPPSLGLLTVCALVAAHEVIVPMQAEYLALRGLGQLSRTVELVRRSSNPALTLAGIVFCQHNPQTRLAQEVRDEVDGHFPGLVYETSIRRNVKLAESPSHSKPVPVYDPYCAGTEDYRALAREFLRRTEGPSDQPEETPPPRAEVTAEARAFVAAWRNGPGVPLLRGPVAAPELGP